MITAGIDLSSRALHAALIPADEENPVGLPPVVFRVVELPRFKAGSATAQYRSVERCRVVRDAVRELLNPMLFPVRPREGVYDAADATSVWVEEPMGARNKATNVLREIYGAVLASVPPHIERASIAPQEWRRVIDPERVLETKNDSINYAMWWLEKHQPDRAWTITEHSCEALLVALAGRHLTTTTIAKGAA